MAFFLALALLSAGCTNLPKGTGEEPTYSKSVGNAKDSFGFTYSAVNHTGSEDFLWENSKTKATVGLSQAQQGGTLIVVIQDATGREVYRAEPKPTRSVVTPTGIPGSWRIMIEFKGLTGSGSLGIAAST